MDELTHYNSAPTEFGVFGVCFLYSNLYQKNAPKPTITAPAP
jgi:hypothetical protein